MEIAQNKDGGSLTVTVTGCLDTTTSPDLMAVFETGLEGVTALLIDFTNLEYVSSAGFRVLLVAHKKMMAAGGEMTIKGVNPSVREVFDMTGFSDIFTIV